jgi:hypothetical protein
MRQERTTGSANGMDDINVPLVAVTVGLFAVTVVVVVVFLQAYYRNVAAREIAVKTRVQEDPTTDLGRMLAEQRAELHVGLNRKREMATVPAMGAASGAVTATTTAASRPARRWIPIDTAMRVVAEDYREGRP